MTKQEMNEYISLRKELAKAQSMRDALRIAAEPGAQVLTGLPHAPGYTDRVGDLAAEISDVSGEMERLQSSIREREPSVQAFIAAIQDNQTRIIFRLRILHTLTWAEIAKAIGGNNTASGVRSSYYRYIKNCCE